MISDVYDSVIEAFKQYGCPAPVYLGEQYADQHLAPLCVVMWQTDDLFTEQIASVTMPMQSMYINPRPIKTRRCGLRARLWATAKPQRNAEDQYRADLATLDALLNQFIVALQHTVPGIYELRGGHAAKGNAATVTSGLGYDLDCLIDIPIIDAPWPAQALDKCATTWKYGRGTAEITISGKVDPAPPYFQPAIVFPVPTEE